MRGKKKKKKKMQARSQGMLSLGIPFTREVNCMSPLGGICKASLYLQLLPAWLGKLKSFSQASQRKREYHFLNSLDGSGKPLWERGSDLPEVMS